MASIPLTRSGPEHGGNFECQWAGSFLQAHLLSHVGEKRSNNEDSCLLCAPEDPALIGERGVLFAVADGMGGVSGGEFASRVALDTLSEEYFGGHNRHAPARLREAIRRANRRIYEEAESHPEYHGMGTTVSAMAIPGDNAYVAQVGDSRVYLRREGTPLWQITDDHSLVAEQVRNGFMSEEEARTHTLKNLITRAVGTKEGVKVDLFAFRLKEGDTILICSDGLSNVVRDTEIDEGLSLQSPQGAARVLVGRALEAGGPDNVTVMVVRVSASPPKTKLDHGAVRVSFTKPGLLGRLRDLIS